MVERKLIITALWLLTGILKMVAQDGPSTFEFVENKGQWDKQIKFKGQLPAGNFYLQPNGFTVVQHNTDDLLRFYHSSHGAGAAKGGKGIHKEQEGSARSAVGKPSAADTPIFTIHSHAYKVQFVGSAAQAQIVPDKALTGYNNYFIGNDRSKWASNVMSYQAVVYKNIYPNIDVRYYSENGNLKYDLIVNPGGNVSNIVMRYEGVNKLQIKNKELIIKTSVGDVKELYPYSYQFDKINGKQEVSCAFELVDANTVRFKVKEHAAGSTLIIDPTLIFSSFTGSRANQYGFTATPGPDGSLFSGGIVFDPGFPVTTGAYQSNYKPGGRNGVDMGILKFSANGSARVYATYLGGGNDDYPHSLVCDQQGNLVVMGRSWSTDYPGSMEGDGGACDIVVSKLNANGTALIGSMRIGGQEMDGVNIEDQQESRVDRATSLLRNYGDDSHSEVILDGAGNIYVAAQTQSDKFPVRGAGFQIKRAGGQDGAILKIDPNCSTILWSTYLGGPKDDAAFVLALDPVTQNVYVAGGTASKNFPGIVAGVYQDTLTAGDGDIDGYVAVISNDGSTLIRSTYLGTKSYDLVYGIQFDRNAFPYVMGVSRGIWPVTSNVNFKNTGSKQFVSKLKKDLSGFEYSTVFGSGSARPNISPVAFLVDRCENVYISGWGGWIIPEDQMPDPYQLAGTAGMPITPDAIKSTTDNRDFYFIVIEKNANSLLYGSFFGQDGGYGEHVDGGTSRFDAQGVIYQAICANCYGNRDFPVTRGYHTTPGVVASSNGMGNSGCNLAALKIAFNFAGVGSGPRAYFNGVIDTVGCVPFTITFRDTIRNAKTYEWDFGDGSDTITTGFEVSHTFTAIGTYPVRLIAVDSSTCNIRDTAYLNIRVRDDKANLDFSWEKLPPCESLLYQFRNTTTFPAGKPFNENSFTWDFGDGIRVTPGPEAIQHSYAAAGTYKVRLILIDTNYCNSPDSTEQELRVSPLVDARFETPPSGCAPYTAIFNNTSLAGQDFFWDFGDGTTSTEVNPVHDYPNVGTFHVKLIAIDSNTCNIIDSTEMDIKVNPLPVADFSWAPVPPQINKPTIFTNLSTGAIRYKYMFGDGDSTEKNNADTVSHQYNETGTFNACLIAYNEFGCTDTICKPVDALIDPLLDVPNAFTPGRFGRNSMITIAGFGIVKLTWKIYNRWGQVVFETNNRKLGWDGTYKGQLQPMDVYAYVLDAEFFDGKKVRKTGDITLIR